MPGVAVVVAVAVGVVVVVVVGVAVAVGVVVVVAVAVGVVVAVVVAVAVGVVVAVAVVSLTHGPADPPGNGRASSIHRSEHMNTPESYKRFRKGDDATVLTFEDGDFFATCFVAAGSWSWVVWDQEHQLALAGGRGRDMDACDACDAAVRAIESRKRTDPRG